MNLSSVRLGPALSVLLAALIALSGCGGDDGGDEPAPRTTAGATPELRDVEPRSAKPNLVGGDAPIGDFAQRAADDAVTYFQSVFDKSGVEYVPPRVKIADRPTHTGCGVKLDPEREASYACRGQIITLITFGAGRLDALRSTQGDAAIAFFLGLVVAYEARLELTPDEPETDAMLQEAGCFAGAWIRNLDDRSLLEGGDNQEIARQAVAEIPGADPKTRFRFVLDGYEKGIEACRDLDVPASSLAAADAPLEPGAARPNFAAGDAPIGEFVRRTASYANDLFGEMYADIGYRAPTPVVADAPREVCGLPFDPQKEPYLLCAGENEHVVTYGKANLEQTRADFGDGAAAFLVVYGLALSAYDQGSGNRLAAGHAIDQQFVDAAVCLVGKVAYYAGHEKMIEAGDDAEFLKVAEAFIPEKTAEGVTLGADIFAAGATGKVQSCAKEDFR